MSFVCVNTTDTFVISLESLYFPILSRLLILSRTTLHLLTFFLCKCTLGDAVDLIVASNLVFELFFFYYNAQ